MRHLTAGIDVAAPMPAVWELLSVFAHWPRWGSSIRDVECDSTRVETGARGRVQTVIGVWLPFTITEVEPQRSWHWKVGGVPATGHYLVSLDPQRSRVEFTVPWLAAPYLAVVHHSLRRLRDVAEAE